MCWVFGVCLCLLVFFHTGKMHSVYENMFLIHVLGSLGRIIKTPRWLSVGTPGAQWAVIKEERGGYVL